MSTIVIGKRFSFDAAHRLPLHDGKCRRPHGHTYVLEVEVEGYVRKEKGPQQGMVMDYGHLKEAVENLILSEMDHQDLNQVMASRVIDGASKDPEKENVTTAEVLVGYCADRLRTVLNFNRTNATLVRVRLQETPNTWAEWRR